MTISVHFYSYFKDFTGCPTTSVDLQEGARISDLHQLLAARFPKLGQVRQCTLVAVGVEYQNEEYALKPGDEVSLFPPVQGG